tara:strand:+ start:170 stop:337 length:168 start_codon:yes stop_codon:yes gene_type:complete
MDELDLRHLREFWALLRFFSFFWRLYRSFPHNPLSILIEILYNAPDFLTHLTTTL